MKTYKHGYSRYNAFDVVKVNIPTIVGALFMARHLLGIFIIGMAFRSGRTGTVESHGAFSGLVEPIYMIADIPAVLVLIAMLSRHPKSGALTRVIWRYGQYLLLASAIVYFFLFFDKVGWAHQRYGWPVWLSLLGTVAVVAYVFVSPYARDLFRQFPERTEKDDDLS
jgi:Protein of unknown function (DUF2919)